MGAPDLDGHRLHFLDEGEWAPLLLLHGNPTWSFLYRDVILRLRGRFRCVAPDHPSFGLSRPAPGCDFLPESHTRVVEWLAGVLGLEGFAVMGQDWGGPIGLWAAARNASRVKGVVLGNTWAWPVDDDPHFRRFCRLMGGPVGRWAILRFNAFVNRMVPAGVKRKGLDPRVRRRLEAAFPG